MAYKYLQVNFKLLQNVFAKGCYQNIYEKMFFGDFTKMTLNIS